MFLLTDKQRLIYDLSLQCAALSVQRSHNSSQTLQAEMLESFIASVQMYRCMDDSALEAVLEELKKA